MKILVLIVLIPILMDNGCQIVSGSDICMLPKKTGPCKANIRRYYYNYRSNRCEIFFYGGCQGNANNFKTICQCRKRCPRTRGRICRLPKVTGPCRAAFRRYYFNYRTKRCELFTYGGCCGNKNNFRNLYNCKLICGGTVFTY